MSPLHKKEKELPHPTSFTRWFIGIRLVNAPCRHSRNKTFPAPHTIFIQKNRQNATYCNNHKRIASTTWLTRENVQRMRCKMLANLILFPSLMEIVWYRDSFFNNLERWAEELAGTGKKWKTTDVTLRQSWFTKACDVYSHTISVCLQF